MQGNQLILYRNQAVEGDAPFLRISKRRIVQLLLLLIIASVMIMGGQLLLNNPDILPLERVVIQGEMQRVSEHDVMKAVIMCRNLNLLACDIDVLQREVHALPWVDTASVRRVWPDSLAINIIEQTPLLHWQQGGLINVRGEIFYPHAKTYPANLPVLEGPQEKQDEMTAFYSDLAKQFKSVGATIRRLELDERHAWRIVLNNGMELMLGRGNDPQRLHRFIQAYPIALAKRSANVERVDLRYPNGFAVRWKNP